MRLKHFAAALALLIFIAALFLGYALYLHPGAP